MERGEGGVREHRLDRVSANAANVARVPAGIQKEAQEKGSGGEAEGGEGCIHFKHRRSRVTTDPRIPAMAGRSPSQVFTDQAGITRRGGADTKKEEGDSVDRASANAACQQQCQSSKGRCGHLKGGGTGRVGGRIAVVAKK